MLIYLADLAHTQSVSDRSLTIPLGIGYIKAYAQKALGASVEIKLFKHPEKLLAATAERAPDIFGFANYGWNDHLNRTIGSYLRSKVPDALFVAGGPNIDPDPELRFRFLERHDYLNYAIVDNGEEAFAELVQWWRSDRSKDEMPGNLLWREDGRVMATECRSLSKEINNIPSPYLDGSLDEFLTAGMVPLFETNRGCPFSCTFCAWGMAAKDLVRRMDFDVALEEIRYVGERSNATNWIVCDANFGILKRDVDLARAIRKVFDTRGLPHKCHLWLAKNVTERNLEIAAILGDMIVPVMAVQSMSDDVLRNIKRDNISAGTYIDYQRKFHALGSTTYSDMIVPLPGETLKSHLDGLRQMFGFDVDIIQNHNMRLLAGAETNSLETRATFGFGTRYRLIHGDAGIYRTPEGAELRSFECEESLRKTTTMSEAELFQLRRMHFLVDFCWNNGVYKQLLRALRAFGGDIIGLLDAMIAQGFEPGHPLESFWRRFDDSSHEEWYDSEDDLRSAFADPSQFDRLIHQEFEKLNISFGVIALHEYKAQFDAALRAAITASGLIPPSILDDICQLCFAKFPPLDTTSFGRAIEISSNLSELSDETAETFQPSPVKTLVTLRSSDKRERILHSLKEAGAKGQTLSKMMNVQGVSLRELELVPV